jgi:hypothetical protein
MKEHAVTAADTLSRFHHPNFVSARPDGHATYFEFRAFTGNEPEPEVPREAHVTRETLDEYQQLRAEYAVAHDMWAQARFRARAIPAIKAAAPAWQACSQAQAAMDAAFGALRQAGDGQWHSAVLRLTDLQKQALAAAGQWDRVAAGLAAIEDQHLREAGEVHAQSLREVARGAGLDITDWHIGYFENRRYQLGFAETVSKAIDGQKATLREVAELAGPPGDRDE